MAKMNLMAATPGMSAIPPITDIDPSQGDVRSTPTSLTTRLLRASVGGHFVMAITARLGQLTRNRALKVGPTSTARSESQ